MPKLIKFNIPHLAGRELDYVREVLGNRHLSGDGIFTQRCHQWLEQSTGSAKALLTHSCTAALEMAALILDIVPGDEIIMPSYTFVSTANAFALRGGVPVFVDIRRDTLNIDEGLIEAAITPRTRAIVPVHYAGVACEMDTIVDLARRYRLRIVEDAAQGAFAYYKGSALGSIGDLGALSFHESKNLVSGEGGALLIAGKNLVERAEIIREKGTDRSQFFRGEVDKYTWKELGSSYLPSEILAAFLFAQLQEAAVLTAERRRIWQRYHELLDAAEQSELLVRPTVPPECEHNGHMYYVLPRVAVDRSKILTALRSNDVSTVSHYVPLHSSPAGRRFGRASGDLRVTDDIAPRLIRLPLWVGITELQQAYVVETLVKILSESR